MRDALGALAPAIKQGKLPPPATEPWEGHVGRSRARSELIAPPLRKTSWWRRAIYLLLRWWAEQRKHAPELQPLDLYRLQAGKVLFRCTLCCQGIRVPTRASLTATCRRCETELPCET